MKRPLVFLVATIASGLACGFFLQSPWASLFLATLALGLGCLFFRKKLLRFLSALLCFTIGLGIATIHLYLQPDLSHLSTPRVIIEGRVLSVPKEYGDYNTLILKSDTLQAVNQAGQVQTVEESAYFKLNYTRVDGGVPSVGDSLRVYGNFEWENTRKRICGTVMVVRAERTENRMNNGFFRFAKTCAGAVSQHIERNYSGQTGALLSAILNGDQSNLSQETKEQFSRAGLTHLVAVSGMNISILLFFFTYLAFFLPRRWKLTLSLPLLLFLVVFTGAPPSILRAAVMSATFLLADLQGRDSDSLTNLFFAAGVLLLFNYDVLYDLSFQLSFLSVLGLILGIPLFTHPFFDRWYGKVLACTIAAQLGSLPVVVGVFGRLCPYGTFTNLLLVPLFPLTIGVCLGALILLVLIPPLGQLMVPVSETLISVYLWVTEKVGNLPGAVIDVGDVSSEIGVFLGCFMVAGYLVLRMKQQKACVL